MADKVAFGNEIAGDRRNPKVRNAIQIGGDLEGTVSLVEGQQAVCLADVH